MSKMSDGDRTYLLTQQYKNSTNLSVRLALHQRYSTSTYNWHKWLFDHFNSKGAAQVLEMGCGNGALWEMNAERIPSDWNILLSDFSQGMVQSAQEHLGILATRFTWQIIDTMNIPYEDESFDIVIANHMLYHVPNRLQALQEIHRVLRQDGHFYASTNGRSHMQELNDLFHTWLPGIERDDTPEKFGLETGEAQLQQIFPHVALDYYPDSLQVTEAEIVIQYLLTSPASEDLTEYQVNRIRDTVDKEIVQNGYFSITKSSGLFHCWK